MEALANKTALVTGGSRGIGRGIVEVLAGDGVKVWALARDAGHLDQLKQDVKGTQTISADVTDPKLVAKAMHDVCPDILVLNAGITPVMKPVQEMSWEEFGLAWETDVKSTFFFGKEAITQPLKPGSVVVIVSSGAAVGGSSLSGGYAGSKRTQWFMAGYFQEQSNRLNLGIRFIALIPRQIVGETELGHQAATRYAEREGITKEQYLARMGATPLTPELVGKGVVSLLTDAAYQDGVAFGINSQGLMPMS